MIKRMILSHIEFKAMMQTTLMCFLILISQSKGQLMKIARKYMQTT